MSIQPASVAVPALTGDTAGGLNLGNWAWTSDDGQYVAFTSDAPNLVAGQVDAQRGVSQWNPDWNPNADVFLYNTQTHEKTLISRQSGATTPTTGNGMSIALGISSNGQYVLFGSVANDLVSLDPSRDSNGAFDIFLYDRLGNGGQGATQLVSHSSVGLTRGGNGESASAVLSADGKYVAFTSNATDLVPSDANNASDVFLFEQATGAITLVSRGGQAGKGSRLPSIRSDNTTVSVAFVSDATNLVAGATDANDASDVFLFDYTIATRDSTIALVSHRDSSSMVTASGASTNPTINSGDGDYVAYESTASDLVSGQSDTNRATDVFLFSRADGVGQSRLVSAVGGSGAGTGSGESTSPVISSDGRYIAFLSQVGNLVAQTEANSGNDVFLFDRDSGSDPSLSLVSHTAGVTTTTANGESSSISMSDDGRYVAFASQATDLVAPPGDGNNGADIFVYDRTQRASRLVSHDGSSATATGDGESRIPVISGDGLSVVYLTDATNLVPGKGDCNVFPDLVQGRYDGSAWTNSFVTLRDPGLPPVTGNGRSYVEPRAGQPVSSADGRFVVFTSQSSNLVDGPEPLSTENVFLYDALTGQVQLVSHAFGSADTGNDSSGAATISADGRYVAFVSKADNLVENLNDRNGMEDVFRFDRLTGEIRLVSGISGSATDTGDRRSVAPAIGADGRFIAFTSSARDLVSGVVDNNQKDDVFLFDASNGGSIRLVSASGGNANVAANGQSSDPTISADGTRVAFLSTASDLVQGQVDGSSTQDVFLLDRTQGSTGQMRMVSRINGTTATAGNGEVVSAVLSANGQFVAFDSLATNLVADQSHDTNSGSDVFLYSLAGTSLELVSRTTGSGSTAADRPSTSPTISADGRCVAFVTYATNLFGRQDDTGGFTNVFLYDRSGQSIQLVSHTVGATETPGDSYSMAPVMSADGRFVAYTSMASNLVGIGADRNESPDVLRFDRLAGANQLVSRGTASPMTPGDSSSSSPSISGDGRSVVFNSQATNLIVGDYNRTGDVFVFRDGGLVNQAPTLNTGVDTALASIDQNPTVNPGTAVDTLVDTVSGTTRLYSDPDGYPPAVIAGVPVAGIAVTAQDTAHGTWWYSTDGGVNWTRFSDSVSDSSATLLGADGAGRNRIRFVPAARYSGTATLSFRAWDGFDGNLSGATGVDASNDSTAYSSQTETASITVVPGANAPVAVNDTGVYRTIQGQMLAVPAERGILSNDTDADGDQLSAIKVSDPQHGILILNVNGSFAYAPNDDFSGQDSFTYKANDGTHDSNVATVTITVDALNQAPVAVDHTFVMVTGRSLVITQSDLLAGATDADGDTLTASTVGSLPAGLTANADGSLTYTPGTFVGTATFSYVVNDGKVNSAPATVTLGVLANSGGGTLVLRRATVNNVDSVQILSGTKSLFSQPLASLQSLKVVGADRKVDTLTVDFNAGGSFSVPGGVVFDGGAGTSKDTLVLHGRAIGSTLKALADHYEFDGASFRSIGVEQARLEGLTGNDTYVVTALPVPLTIKDTGGTDTLDFTGVAQQVSFNPTSSSAQRIFGTGNTLTVSGKVETTIIQYGPDPKIYAPAGSGTNSLVLSLQGGYVRLLSGKNLLLNQPLATLNSLEVDGAANKSDTLTVDFNVGGVFRLPGGVAFVGGDGTKPDTLVVRGTPGSDTFRLLTDRAVFNPGPAQTDFPISGVELVRFEGLAGNDTYAVSALPVSLTSLTVNETAGADTLDFSGVTSGVGVTVSLASTSAQKIFGGTATLTVKGAVENIAGTPYADKITGSSGANVIRGLGGNDSILGGSGNDIIYGGDGDDTVYGGAGNDVIFGEGGNNTLYGDAGNNVLVGGAGSDVLTAGAGRNVLIGGAGQDTLKGASADDILIGSTTLYDQSLSELLAILNEWSLTKVTAAQRVADLKAGIAGPNGQINLRIGEGVLNDGVADSLFGGPGSDWYLWFDGDTFVDQPGTGDFSN